MTLLSFPPERFEIRFEVRDKPVPQGSMKHIGGGRLIASNKPFLETWREAVKTAAVQAMNGMAPQEGPLEVVVDFGLTKPLSAPKRKKTWPIKAPDLDKLVRAVNDSLTAAGVWRDDAQVVSIIATKLYTDDMDWHLPVAGALISVRTYER